MPEGAKKKRVLAVTKLSAAVVIVVCARPPRSTMSTIFVSMYDEHNGQGYQSIAVTVGGVPLPESHHVPCALPDMLALSSLKNF